MRFLCIYYTDNTTFSLVLINKNFTKSKNHVLFGTGRELIDHLVQSWSNIFFKVHNIISLFYSKCHILSCPLYLLLIYRAPSHPHPPLGCKYTKGWGKKGSKVKTESIFSPKAKINWWDTLRELITEVP